MYDGSGVASQGSPLPCVRMGKDSANETVLHSVSAREMGRRCGALVNGSRRFLATTQAVGCCQLLSHRSNRGIQINSAANGTFPPSPLPMCSQLIEP